MADEPAAEPIEQPARRKLEQARDSYKRLQRSLEAIPYMPKADIEGQVADVLGKIWSVVYCLEHLWEKRTGHKTWQGLWRGGLVEPERQLLNQLEKLRNEEVHETGADTALDMKYQPIHSLPQTGQPHLVGGFVEAAPPGTPPAQIGRPVYHFKDWPAYLDGGGEILDACSRFLGLVEQGITHFVAECNKLP